MRIIITLLSLVIVGSMLAACMKKSPTDNMEHVLRIASSYEMDEDYFRQQYTELFEFANNDIKIEIIPTENVGGMSNSGDNSAETTKSSLDMMMELMEGPNPPDLRQPSARTL